MFQDNSEGRIDEYKKLLLFVDGGCEPKNPGGVATAGWVLYDPKNPDQPLVEEGRAVQDGGTLATNNFGEYAALYYALKWLRAQNWRGELEGKADSKLLVEQVCGRWKCKAAHLLILRAEIWKMLDDLNLQVITEDNLFPDEDRNPFCFTWIPRESNTRANDLCHLAYEEYKAGGKLTSP